MTLKLRSVFLFSVSAIVASGCTYTFSEGEQIESIPVGSIKPDLDFSADAPDCVTAAQRIEDNLQIGMTLADVRRLVGPPRVVLPGSWWWTAGFGNEGLPNVRYAFGPGDDDVQISSVSTDSSSC